MVLPYKNNRERLESRLNRFAKLLSMNAPRTIILSEYRMVQDAWIDCEQYGYDVLDTRSMRDAALDADIERIETEHLKHMDGKPVEGCEMCEEPEPDAP
jgi:hypothetical protein